MLRLHSFSEYEDVFWLNPNHIIEISRNSENKVYIKMSDGKYYYPHETEEQIIDRLDVWERRLGK